MTLIMTFNMRLDLASDGSNAWRYRVDSVASFINRVKPLVIGAQEILPAMRADLVKRLPEYAVFGREREPDSEASPIFYRRDVLTLVEGETFWLSKTPYVPYSRDFNSAYVRVCTWAIFAYKDHPDRMFRFYNTHLDHKSEEARVEGLRIIFNHICSQQAKRVLPVLLTGDFNDTPGSLTLGVAKNYDSTCPVQHVYETRGIMPSATIHEFRGCGEGEPIDYVLHSADIAILSVDIVKEKMPHGYMSDHFPVVVEVDIFQTKN